MKETGYLMCLVIAVTLAGCKPQKAATTVHGGTRYSEDLSVWRPKVEAPKDSAATLSAANDARKTTPYIDPKYAVNQKLDAVLDSIDRIFLARKFVDGFTIQVYSGKREDALNTKRQLNSVMPDLATEVQFTEPIFRVKAGKYYSMLDAQKDLYVIKRYFPSAIVVPDKIALN